MLDVSGFRFGEAGGQSDAEKGREKGITAGTPLRDIAIIGLSVNLPQAEDADRFWRCLREGRDAVGPFPAARRDDVGPYIRRLGLDPAKVAYFDGAYLEEIDRFDPGFFRMSPRDAALTSPSQRLFLQTAWKAVEDAGYGGGRLTGTNTGVYVGYCADAIHDYKRLIAEEDPAGIPIAVPGNLTSVIAGRISFLLDWKGPALTVDTACSSSLVAVHLACRALRSGECGMALAGSVKTLLLPIDTGMRVGIESRSGRARTFDDGADGTAMGEGSAAVLLKPLAQALADGDPVHAVIKGSAVNQDGASAGLTAPNAAAQEEAIVQAWLDAGIDPASVSYIEAHGTGTKLGDPIEIEGIGRAFRRFTGKRQFCAVGSVKTNVGHLDNAAGIVGLAKAVLALKHRELPPSLHYRRPNRHIDFIDSPVYVNDTLTHWEAGPHPRRCGVSAFGLCGTNAHVVLEEAPESGNGADADGFGSGGPALFVLSARSAGSLARALGAYAVWFGRSVGEGFCLADLCYTASTGRSHFERRLAAVVSDAGELARLVREAASRPPDRLGDAGFLCSHADGGRSDGPTTASASASEEARELADRLSGGECGEDAAALLGRLGLLYVQGAEIPWERLYARQRRKRLHLPTYSFDKARCWVDGGGIADGKQSSSPRDSEAIGGGERMGRDERTDEDAVRAAVEAAWMNAIGTRPGPADDFFAAGGHSLSAVQLVAQLNQAFGIELSPGQMFLTPTASSLAEEIRRRTPGVTNDRIPKCETGESYPASSAQKRLYILNEIHGDGIGYNMPALLEIEGAADKEKLVGALRTVIGRHESLRTTFGWENGEIVQRVHPHAEPAVTFREVGPGGLDDAIRSFVRPFRLDRLPLLRIALIKQEAGKCWLLFDMHHIVSDGFSVGKLAGEIAQLIAGAVPPPLPVQYKDYAAWQAKRIASDALLAHERYWKQRFGEPAPKLRFPADRAGESPGQAAAHEGRTVFFQADEALDRRLSELAARTGTTLFTLLLAVYNVLLFKYTGQEDIVVGTAVAGRTRAELEPLIGMFANTLALRNYPAGNKTFRRFLAEVKESTREALEHQEYPFERLAEALDGSFRPGESHPLFDTMYVHQNTAPPERLFGDAVLRPHPYDFGIAKFDLTLQSWSRGDTLDFALEYRTARFRHDEMTAFARHYVRLLSLAAFGTDFQLKDADLLDETERARLRARIRASQAVVFKDFDFDE